MYETLFLIWLGSVLGAFIASTREQRGENVGLMFVLLPIWIYASTFAKFIYEARVLL